MYSSEYNSKNKGFSLVELIIVIAIMAVIIAILTPQYLKYIETSKRGKDYEVAAVVQQALEVAMTDTSISDRPISLPLGSLSDIDNGSMPEFAAAIKEYIGTTDLDKFMDENIRSNAYVNQNILVEIDTETDKICVMIKSNISNVDDIVIE